MSDYVWVKYEDSPVRVRNSNGENHLLQIEMDDGIQAIGSFPATGHEGKYTLELQKAVTDADKVIEYRDDLLSILRELSLVWPFAGGTRMPLQKNSMQTESIYTTNAHELLDEMLARKGTSRFSHSMSLKACIIGTYTDYPLKLAYDIMQHMHSDFYFRMMLEYYNEAYVDERAWFIHLYKIKDSLVNAAEKRNENDSRFGIKSTRWGKFERILNAEFNLRHAPKERYSGQIIGDEEKNEAFTIGREMIVAYMNERGIEHIGTLNE